MAVYSSVLDLIGNTPIVDVSALSPSPGVRILAKLEGQNPAGSVKDRIAKAMIEEAEADGTLSPGKTIVESSSGNTGIAMAMICQLKGYPLKIVLPANVSIERRQLLEVFGAEIILSPGEEGSNGALRRAQDLAAEHTEWAFLYQYANEANPRAHYESTGPEILTDVPDITHFVAGLGTSGTLMGVGTYLKEHKPDVKVLAVEPPAGELVEGLRNLDDGYIPPVFDKWGGNELLDGKRVVRPRESLVWTRRLVNEIGVFAGISSGAALAGAIKVAERIDEGVIVFIVCDGGWKYLSTGAYTDDLGASRRRPNPSSTSTPRRSRVTGRAGASHDPRIDESVPRPVDEGHVA
ncbi:MAG: pyridoxal-phosphate dependent enzyme [Acidimicrobiales bacterium]